VEALEAGVPEASLPALDTAGRALLRRGFEVPAEAQIALQARFQSYVDGGVSKTVHLPPDCPATRIARLILEARARGCKGVAFWRPDRLSESPCVRCGGLLEGAGHGRAEGSAPRP